MNVTNSPRFLVGAAIVTATLLATVHAQNANTIHSVTEPALNASSSATMTSSTPDPTMATLVRNRARIFGDRLSAADVRYWYLDGSELKGKTPDQVLQHLSPVAITAGDHVREMDIVVDLHQPLTIFASPGQSISIGTATVNGADVHSIAVTAIVSMAGLSVTPK